MSIIIAAASKMSDAQVQQLQLLDPRLVVRPCWEDRDRLAREGGDVQIVYGNVRAQELAKLPMLQWVHATWTGVENLLASGLAESNVIVTNTRGQNAGPMAEHGVAGLLYLARDLAIWNKASREGQWRTNDQPVRVEDSVVLVLGTGAIARQLIPLLNGLRMRVWGVNSDGRAIDGCEQTFTMQSVRPRLSEVQFVICLLPDGSLTHRIINRGFLSALKSGAGVVNLSRGGVVDQEALVELIDAGQLRGAVLDVTTPEPPLPGAPLFGHERILLTGHASWKPSPENGLGFTVFTENLRQYLAGKTDAMVNVVDKQRGY